MDTDTNIDEKRIWFWNKSPNELESDLKYSDNSKEERNLTSKTFRTEQKVFL